MPDLNRSRCQARVRRSRTASRAPSSTGVGVVADETPESCLWLGSAEGFEHLLLRPPEELGKDPVHHHRRKVDGGLFAQASCELHRLVHRHLFWGRDDHEARLGGVGEDVEHPVGLDPDEPHLHQLVDGLRSGQLADDVPSRWTRPRRRCRSASRGPRSRASRLSGSRVLRARLSRRSRTRGASGPMRPTTGMRSWSFRYSRRDASVSIDMTRRPGNTSFPAKVEGPVS